MGKQVLLIEDEPNIIEAISFILSRSGWEVRTHSHGHDAMQVIKAQNPDVLILDVMLPGKSGYDVLRELRADADFADLPVLILTARGQMKDRAMAQEAGASDFMTKPFANADVVEALDRLVAS